MPSATCARSSGCAGADREGARPDRRACLRILLPHRARHRALRPRARHPVPGPRLGGQLGGVLLPVHHRGRPRSQHPCCSSASSRASATSRPTSTSTSSTSGARKSSSTSTASTARTRRAGRDRDQLPPAQRGARRGQGAGAGSRRSSSASRSRCLVGPPRRSRASASRNSIGPTPQAGRMHFKALVHSPRSLGFPRHLSQHVGGFVITRSPSRRWCRSRMPRWPIAP
jgi:hypothetical protein